MAFVTLDNPTEDGYILLTPPADYDRKNAEITIQLMMAYTQISRGYVEWDVSSIPDCATITRVVFKYHTYARIVDGHIHEMVAARPSISTDQEVYDEAGEGTIYAEPAGFPEIGTGKEVDLGASAVSDLQGLLVSNWFAIGLQSDDEADDHEMSITAIYSEDHTPADPKPTLYVEYTAPFPVADGNLIGIPIIRRS